MITVTGVLTNPMNEPVVGATIRIEALSNNEALLGSTAEVVTDGSGNYSFSLAEGKHRVEVDSSDEYVLAGEVFVTAEMDTNTYTLPDLLNLLAV